MMRPARKDGTPNHEAGKACQLELTKHPRIIRASNARLSSAPKAL